MTIFSSIVLACLSPLSAHPGYSKLIARADLCNRAAHLLVVQQAALAPTDMRNDAFSREIGKCVLRALTMETRAGAAALEHSPVTQTTEQSK